MGSRTYKMANAGQNVTEKKCMAEGSRKGMHGRRWLEETAWQKVVGREWQKKFGGECMAEGNMKKLYGRRSEVHACIHGPGRC